LTKCAVCGILITERKKEVIKMYKFLLEHRYCGMRKIVKGNNVWKALHDNGLDEKVWVVVTIIP
jgi:hypothetical protein